MPQMNDILENILDTLSEDKMQEIIDDPIDQAVNSFSYPLETVNNHREFNRTMGAFVLHLYKHGLRASRNLTDPEAREEAIWFLEQNYSEEKTKGYDGALLNALSDNPSGISGVLGKIAQAFKDRERNNYSFWVLTSNIDPSDWQLRIQLTQEYLQQYGWQLPPEVQTYQISQIANHLEDLLLVHVSTKPAFSSPSHSSTIDINPNWNELSFSAAIG
jgi:hypothetical protein